jgi:predicted DNA-binding protein YlxM (UPF0122 family)
MINWNNIKKYKETIKKYKEKLELETKFVPREKLKIKAMILELRVKIEKLNY